jgi:hypothetical protein
VRRAIQTKSTSEKGAVMCYFRWGANPGWGLSFAVGCCGAPFWKIQFIHLKGSTCEEVFSSACCLHSL